MHEKSVRNKILLESQRDYRRRLACKGCISFSYPHPLRPASKHQQFVSIGGFNQHPNTTQDM
jgi:hypothetical protein